MRLVGPLLVVAVTVTALRTHPAAGRSGGHLATAVAIGGFALGGFGTMIARRGPRPLRVACVAALFGSAVVLVWFQSDTTGVFALLVAVILVARRVPPSLAISLSLLALVLLTVTTAISSRRSVSSALLMAMVFLGFYGVSLLAERLRDASEQAEALLVELEEKRAVETRAVALAEGQRLAREMHDVLAHSLSGLMLQLEGARLLAVQNPDDPRLLETIERAHHLGKTGLDEARQAIGMLRGDDLPGPDSLSVLTAKFQEDLGIPCQFIVSGEICGLGSETRLAIYRVAQEALTNITKHAHPDRVEVSLAYEGGETRLTVEDFGPPGQRPTSVQNGSGYGLTGMRERAELLGGKLTSLMTMTGFRVELEVPVVSETK